MKSTLLLISLLACMSCTKEAIVAQKPIDVVPTEPKVYEINKENVVWSDEFDYDGKPKTTHWSYDIGGHGWGNNENQFYTDRIENAFVKDGHLHIKAIKENYQNSYYTSARLVSKGKGDFQYGRFEIKAKLPSGVGTWPAIWMLASQTTYGNAYWPDNGEIDIMEHVGFDQNIVHGNIHTKAFNHSIGTNKGNKTSVPKASEEFHVYATNWLPDRIEVEVDGGVYFTFYKNAGYTWQEWPFDKPFHLLLNIAIGGSWGGQKGVDDSIFPQEMTVDYVRVYGIKEK